MGGAEVVEVLVLLRVGCLLDATCLTLMVAAMEILGQTVRHGHSSHGMNVGLLLNLKESRCL